MRSAPSEQTAASSPSAMPTTRKRRTKKTPPPPRTDLFTILCRTDLGMECVKEYQFHPTRKWRFDYAIPSHKIAIEVEGGVWTQGRHIRAKGFLGDMEKYNEAAADQWLLLRVTPDTLLRSATLALIKKTAENRKKFLEMLAI